jgi:hypothetical protein
VAYALEATMYHVFTVIRAHDISYCQFLVFHLPCRREGTKFALAVVLDAGTS